MKHRAWFLILLLVFSFGLISCVDTSINLDEIDIEAVDQIDVPVGTYTVAYTIEDLSSLVKDYGATVVLSAVDSDGTVISVTGNTFTVEENEVYTVTIALTMQGETKTKTITITALTTQTPTTVSVTFVPNGGSPIPLDIAIPFGSAPLLPSLIKAGYLFSGWYLDAAFTILYEGTSLNEDVTLYAKWVEESVSTTLVSFNLMGGVGTFSTQTVAIGSFAIRPTAEPTKEGFTFCGWFLSLQDPNAFDFEGTMVYSELTLLAKWEEIITDEYKVTYDLNGATQTEEWSELVAHFGFAAGPAISPVRQGHLFQGWAYDQNGLAMFDFSGTPIISDLTLYAVWHVDFEVVIDDAAFDEANANDAFELTDGNVFQKYELFANVSLTSLENNHSINEDRIEYGVMLGSEGSSLSYYNKNHVKILGDLEPEQLDDTLILTFRPITDNLVEEATYFYRFYIRYEQTIVYSDAHEFQTLSVVANGTAVGLSGILSGGVYKIDNGTDVWRPAVYVSVLEGYEASLEGAVQSSFFTLYREGVRSIVTTDTQTGKRYLHVFKLDFQTPDVVLTLTSVQTVDGDASPIFRIVFPNDEHINYPTPSVGVLYSRTIPFLKLGLIGVSTHFATLSYDQTEFTLNNPISSSSDSVYVRGYATMNGKTSYSRYVYLLTKNVEGAYQVSKQIDMDAQRIAPSSSYSWSFGPTATVRVYQQNQEGDWTYQSYQNSVEITALGQYFVQMEGVDHIVDVVINEDYPMPTGIVNGETYVGSVFAEIDFYNADWYYSYNNGDFEYLPSSVRFEQEGYYQVFVRGGYGYVRIEFTITHQSAE